MSSAPFENRSKTAVGIALALIASLTLLIAPASARPSPPTGLTVTEATPTIVALEWTENPAATSYRIYRSTVAGQVSASPLATTTDPGYIDTTVQPETSYWYYLKSVDVAGSESWRSGMVQTTTPSVALGVRLVAVGDLADCSRPRPARAVSGLLDTHPGPLLLLGDMVYPGSDPRGFDECFDPMFGRHKDRILPVAGNHEYKIQGASAYASYFGASAGPSDRLYYETQVGEWQVLVLNSNCSRVGGCATGSTQYRWLEDRLSQSSQSCRLVAMHHPRWASYDAYADQAMLAPIYDLLYRHGTDLVLSGHAHHYERFAPQDPSGVADPARGFQLMVLGTGGAPLRTTSNPPAANSEVRARTRGITEFDLMSGSFAWSFINTNGTVLDSGSRDCIAKSDQVPTGALPRFHPGAKRNTPIGAEVFRLYRAVFRRNPEPAGFAYWHDLRQANTDLQFVADFFAASEEFARTYGRLDDTEFIDQLYLNVFGRDADAGGRAYWLTQIANGAKRGDIIVWFSQSQEFVTANPFG